MGVHKLEIIQFWSGFFFGIRADDDFSFEDQNYFRRISKNPKHPPSLWDLHQRKNLWFGIFEKFVISNVNLWCADALKHSTSIYTLDKIQEKLRLLRYKSTFIFWVLFHSLLLRTLAFFYEFYVCRRLFYSFPTVFYSWLWQNSKFPFKSTVNNNNIKGNSNILSKDVRLVNYESNNVKNVRTVKKRKKLTVYKRKQR